jgi:Uma2 family endonuclease
MTRTATLRRPKRKVTPPAAATSPYLVDPLVDALGDQRLVLRDVPWESYVAINDAMVERPSIRMSYCDRRLTLLTESRKHGWSSRCLFALVVALAEGLGMSCEVAGSATFRKQEKSGGVEGDETFYFGEHAERMKGPQDIDLHVQPPPDLAIEIEVSHSADDAVTVWGRLGVPEVWRFDPIARECSFWKRRRNGTYAPRARSVAFPKLTPADVLEQMQQADQLTYGAWNTQLRRWVRKEIVPRSQASG